MTARCRTVLVLEDTPSRVRWLGDLCQRHGATLVATSTVRRFLSEIATIQPPCVVVLDHDLGGYSMPVSLQDADGLDGMDAVQAMPPTLARFLIWSTNHTEAPRMAASLRSRGYSWVVQASWAEERELIESTLHDWLTD